MGEIISAIVKSVEEVVKDVTKLVTDVGTAVTQLGAIAEGFAPKHADSFVITMDNAQDLPSALKNAMTAGQKKASEVYAKNFPDVTAGGVDGGFVTSYSPGGNVQPVVAQITNDFKNWQIDAGPSTIQAMAATIQEQVKAQHGLASTASGHHSINMNQAIDWVVAYGLFAQGPDNNALVYAYTAGLSSGFGAVSA